MILQATILVGANGAENHPLLSRARKGQYIWLLR